MRTMKPAKEYIEGPEAAKRMDATMQAILAVPREEILKREAAYQARAKANPNRRGPKRKK